MKNNFPFLTMFNLEYKTKYLKRLFIMFILLWLLYIYYFIYPGNGIFPSLNQNESDDNSVEVYLLSDIPILTDETADIEGLEVDKIHLGQTKTVKDPSIFIFSYEEIEKINKEKENEIKELLNIGHMILFFGLDLDPEKVVSFFNHKDIPVVPIESSNPLYYHTYGATYSEEAEQFIPIFYVSNSKNNIELTNYYNSLKEISNNHMAKTLQK